MENTTSLLFTTTIYSGSDSVSMLAFLPLFEGFRPLNPIIHYREPNKPSRGRWFHALKVETPRTTMFTYEGKEYLCGGVQTMTSINRYGNEVVVVALATGLVNYSITGSYNRERTRTTVYVNWQERKDGELSGKTATYWYRNVDVTMTFDADLHTPAMVVANPWYYVELARSQAIDKMWTPTTISGSSLKLTNELVEVDDVPTNLSFNYKYNEYDNWLWIRYTPIIPGRLTAGLSAAYLGCVRDIPQAQTNMIENVLQSIKVVSGLIKSLSTRSVGPLIRQIAKSGSDPKKLWLTYRYSVKTTESDFNDLKDLTARLNDLSSFKGQTITLRGSYVNGEITYRCAATYQLSDVLPKNLTDKLATFGLRLDLANTWDLLPFSFIVDWFTGLGDLFADVDNLYLAHQYKPVSIWYSYETIYDNQQIYTRFPGPPLYTSPFTQIKETKTSTWLMRLADVLSIFG